VRRRRRPGDPRRSSPDAIRHAADLVIMGEMMEPSIDTLNVSIDSCVLEETCVTGSGQRTIIRFNTASYNMGDSDLFLGEPDCDYEAKTCNAPWFWGACHDHPHFLGFATYELVSAEGVIASGHKQAFCLLDLMKVQPTAGDAKYHCGYQGITEGWADVYTKDLDCQWIDVTDVPAGTYTLRVALNPEHNLVELDYDNNIYETLVTIE
jgi:hypothetical protein